MTTYARHAAGWTFTTSDEHPGLVRIVRGLPGEPVDVDLALEADDAQDIAELIATGHSDDVAYALAAVAVIADGSGRRAELNLERILGVEHELIREPAPTPPDADAILERFRAIIAGDPEANSAAVEAGLKLSNAPQEYPERPAGPPSAGSFDHELAKLHAAIRELSAHATAALDRFLTDFEAKRQSWPWPWNGRRRPT